MKKVFYSLFMVAALTVSTSVIANNETKKESDSKAKTENCDKKKDKDAASCDKKKDEKKSECCSEKKDKTNCPAESKTTQESKSCGKK